MVNAQLSVSLDGYAAGPHQSLEHPLGEGGERLHEWVFAAEEGSADAQLVGELVTAGAYVMGRRMFGGGDGPWDLEGGTTFHFVTHGPESALERARAAAGDRDVAIAGGASTVQQYLRAGRLEELHVHIVPVVLGAGERLLEGVGDVRFEPVEVVASPAVTHVRYRVLP